METLGYALAATLLGLFGGAGFMLIMALTVDAEGTARSLRNAYEILRGRR